MRIFAKLWFFSLIILGCQSMPPAGEDPYAVNPLKEGQIIPDVELKTVDDRPVLLRDSVAHRPTVLVFYRGGWCPYCNTQLAGLRKIQGELSRLGYQIIGISPDKPARLLESIKKNSLGYSLLSDQSGEAAASFGLAFRVDEATRKKYKGYGIDLEEASGERHFTLPVPAVYIVNQQGIAKFVYYNPDYKVRLAEAKLLAKAKELAGK